MLDVSCSYSAIVLNDKDGEYSLCIILGIQITDGELSLSILYFIKGAVSWNFRGVPIKI